MIARWPSVNLFLYTELIAVLLGSKHFIVIRNQVMILGSNLSEWDSSFNHFPFLSGDVWRLNHWESNRNVWDLKAKCIFKRGPIRHYLISLPITTEGSMLDIYNHKYLCLSQNIGGRAASSSINAWQFNHSSWLAGIVARVTCFFKQLLIKNEWHRGSMDRSTPHYRADWRLGINRGAQPHGGWLRKSVQPTHSLLASFISSHCGHITPNQPVQWHRCQRDC